MTFRETQQFLTGAKLRLVKSDKARHIGFDFLLPNGKSPFPQLIRLSRSTGDVPKYVIDSVATAIGLTVHEFETMAKCGLRRECYLLALAVVMLSKYYDDSITYMGMVASVRLLLQEMDQSSCRDWKAAEGKLAARLSVKLEAMNRPSTTHFDEVRDQIRVFLNLGFAAGQAMP